MKYLVRGKGRRKIRPVSGDLKKVEFHVKYSPVIGENKKVKKVVTLQQTYNIVVKLNPNVRNEIDTYKS